MAHISASVYTSHVPAIGAALDLGKTAEPYWQPVFKGYEYSKQWLQDNPPDVVFLVYNDHATAFSLDFIPTFAIGTAALIIHPIGAQVAFLKNVNPQTQALGQLDRLGMQRACVAI